MFKKRIIKKWEEKEDGTIILHDWGIEIPTNKGISVIIDKDLVQEIQKRAEKRLTTKIIKDVEDIAESVKQVITE